MAGREQVCVCLAVSRESDRCITGSVVLRQVIVLSAVPKLLLKLHGGREQRPCVHRSLYAGHFSCLRLLE